MLVLRSPPPSIYCPVSYDVLYIFLIFSFLFLRNLDSSRGRGGVGDGEGKDGDKADRERDEQTGDFLEAEEWASEEGVRALGPVRRRGRPHRLLPPGEALRVLQHQVRHPSLSPSDTACILYFQPFYAFLMMSKAKERS